MKYQIDDTYKILKIIENNNSDTQRSIAISAGFSLGKVNYLLKALVEKGIIKFENFSKSGNKMGYRYILTPKGLTEKIEITKAFLRRKEEEYVRLKVEIEELRMDYFN